MALKLDKERLKINYDETQVHILNRLFAYIRMTRQAPTSC